LVASIFAKTTKPVRQMTGFEVFALEARKLFEVWVPEVVRSNRKSEPHFSFNALET
jgi:hypothetical protein